MIIETRLIQPGRPTGVYEASGNGYLRLIEIVLPEVSLPFDMAVLPNTLTENGENLQVILIGEISHPPQTRVTARLLGGIQRDGADPYLLGVPIVDERYTRLNQVVDLPHALREELVYFTGNFSDQQNSLLWLDADSALSIFRQAVVRLRQAKLESDREASAQPSWRPADRDGRVVGYTEVEHYTDAEYTYFQLPYRFQLYMDQHLANDERILFALSRPAMRSRLHGTWLSRKKLQEGVLILTDQRLIQLVELVPPDSSNVRYGFEASMGILERLEEASIKKLENDILVLRTAWRAGDGVESLEWEFPHHCQAALEELLSSLSKFVADSRRSCALRRAALPPVPESLPPLKDPAANDPRDVEPIIARFVSSLPGWLTSEEKLLYWALWPAWFEKKGLARVLLVTNHRLCVMPDPVKGYTAEIEFPHNQVSSLEYVGSILSSHIGLSIFDSGILHKVNLNFPYPAGHGFHACFEALRRCVAIVPV